MKLIIFGSRNKYPTVNDISYAISLCVVYPTEVVCGVANGADNCGRYWAEVNGVPVKAFPADWEKHGRNAGFVRNKEMGKYADAGIGFWNGSSGGTANMAAILLHLKKPVWLF